MSTLPVGKKKRAKGKSNRYDERPKRVASDTQRISQNLWRLWCLTQRTKENRLTPKNEKELERVSEVLFVPTEIWTGAERVIQ